MSLNDVPGERGLGLMPEVYLGMLRHCLDRRPEEAVGMLVREPTSSLYRPIKFMALSNVAPAYDRGRRFDVDPEEQKRVRQRWTILGLVHSHPEGEARPSDYDRESWVENGWWYLVVGLATGQPRVGCYWVQNGEMIKRKLRVI